MERFEIVIAGGGLAAAKTAEAYRAAGGSGSVVVLGGEPHVPYHRPPLSKRILRGEAEPDSAHVHPRAWYAETGVDLRLATAARALDPANRAVRTDGGDVGYERLVIATGALPRELDGAVTLRTIDDSLAIRERAKAAGSAVLIGAGFIGCEVCASLCALDVEVTLVTGGRPLFGGFGSGDFSAYLYDLYCDRGAKVADRAPGGGFVVAGIGVEPATGWLDGSGIDVKDGVVVNERFETSLLDVYAVGDVARFYDPLFGRDRRIEHWSNANYQGTQLGKALAGEDASYDTVSSFFTELFGTTFRVFGELRGENSLEGAFEEGRAIVRYREDGKLVGALTSGLEDDEQDALKDEIRKAAGR